MGSANEQAMRDWLGSLDDSVQSPLKATAIELARAMDRTSSARDLAAIAGQLRSVVADLEALRSEPVVDDTVSRLRASRAKRMERVQQMPGLKAKDGA